MYTLETNCITIKGELQRRLRLSRKRLIELKEENLVWSTYSRYGADFPGRWLDAMALLNDMGMVEDDSCIRQVAKELLERQCPEGCYAPSADYCRSSFQSATKQDKGMDTVAPLAFTVWFCEERGYMGLLSLYKTTGDKKYLDSVRRAADFAIDTIDISRWPEQNAVGSHQRNLRLWLVAIVEGLVDLSVITKDKKYLPLAEKLAAFLPPIDPKIGFQHAHGYFTALRGVLNLYEVTRQKQLFEFVSQQWQTVVGKYMWVNGGIPEVFPNIFGGDESCQCSDWFRLNLQLWRITGEAKYMDIAELTLFNHFFFQQWLNGGFEYGAQLERGVRWFEMYFCCSMQGPKGLIDAAQNIVTFNDNTISVNFLFDINAKVPFSQGQVGIDVKSSFPKIGTTVITLILSKSMSFELALRIPSGCENARLTVNGKPVNGRIERGYLRCKRQWDNGDKIEFNFAMPVRFVPCKKGGSTKLIYRGPVIMALRRQIQEQVYRQVDESLPSVFVHNFIKQTSPLMIDGKKYKNSFTGFCNDGQIMFKVPDGVNRLIGKYCMPQKPQKTEAKGYFHVYLDGRECYSSGIINCGDPVGEFDIKLEGAKTVVLAAESENYYSPTNFACMDVQLLPGKQWLTEMKSVDTVSVPIDSNSIIESDSPVPLPFAEPLDGNWNVQLNCQIIVDGGQGRRSTALKAILVPMAQVCYDAIPEKCICEGFARHTSEYNRQPSQYRIFFSPLNTK